MNPEYIQAINEVFALFRINYHNQYNAAYKDNDFTNNTKALWAESLLRFDNTTLINAAKKIIKESEFLPTLNKMIKSCNELGSTVAMPDAHSAYVEACNAISPKTDVNWSHPAVYFAGQKTGWFFIANNSEKIAFPIFKSHYNQLHQQVINGESLPTITPSKPTQKEAALSKEENIARMEKLRAEMNI